MKRLPALFLAAALVLHSAVPAIADDGGKPGVALYSNLAYLALTALSAGGSSMFLVLPAEGQIGVSPRLSVNPAVTAIVFGSESTEYGGLMALGECGFYYHTRGPTKSGWKIGLVPGLAYAFDNSLAGFSAGAAAGYQWVLGRWYLGALAGAREVFMDGSIFIPDLKLLVGVALY